MSKGYWEKRREALLAQMEKDEKRLNVKLSKAYAKEGAALSKEIASYYQRYGEGNVIEYRSLLQTFPDEDRQMLIERMDEFGRKYPQYAHVLPVRASVYKLDRLEGLQLSMMMQQLEIGALEQEAVQEHLEKQAQRGANLAAEQMGFGANFYTVDASVVAATVGASWAQGGNFSERIWGNRQKLAAYLSDDFAKAVARGDSYERCSKAIAERFANVSKRDISRLVYTEGTFVFNEAHAQAVEQDFEYYRLACMSKGACPVCKGLEDKHKTEPVKFSERKPGVNFPPMHPWCRCRFTIVTSRDAWNKGDPLGVNEPSESGKSRRTPKVDFGYVDSDEYRKAFDFFKDKELGDLICGEARRMLKRRTGTTLEDFAAMSIGKKIVAARFSSSKESKQALLPRGTVADLMRAKRGDLVALHNHPESMPPSFSDFYLLTMKSIRYGLIACHDGSVVRYRITDMELFKKVVEERKGEEMNRYIVRNEVKFGTKEGGAKLASDMERRFGVTFERLN